MAYPRQCFGDVTKLSTRMTNFEKETAEAAMKKVRKLTPGGVMGCRDIVSERYDSPMSPYLLSTWSH